MSTIVVALAWSLWCAVAVVMAQHGGGSPGSPGAPGVGGAGGAGGAGGVGGSGYGGEDALMTWVVKNLGVPGTTGVLVLALVKWGLPPLMRQFSEMSAAKVAAEKDLRDASQKLLAGQLEVNKSQTALTVALNEAQSGARELLRDVERIHSKLLECGGGGGG